MRVLGIIPARYASSRFPGKPLVDIKGKTMIQRVYEGACACDGLDEVVVATDHQEIYSCVKDFAGKVEMTSPNHMSGTDRCAEVLDLYAKRNLHFDIVINIQGDEPFICVEQIEALRECFSNQNTDIATLVKKIDDSEELHNPNNVKVVFSKNRKALYFSRQAIPFMRNEEQKTQWISKHNYFKHIGVYAYRADVLREVTKLSISTLEKSESLEQLRWLENDYEIVVAETSIEAISVDTPEDLEKLLKNI
ncbi:MAG: 3-deoxy-manno-octulosonate cytidylyltransferase [Bacteroidales bacterium]